MDNATLLKLLKDQMDLNTTLIAATNLTDEQKALVTADNVNITNLLADNVELQPVQTSTVAVDLNSSQPIVQPVVQPIVQPVVQPIVASLPEDHLTIDEIKWLRKNVLA